MHIFLLSFFFYNSKTITSFTDVKKRPKSQVPCPSSDFFGQSGTSWDRIKNLTYLIRHEKNLSIKIVPFWIKSFQHIIKCWKIMHDNNFKNPENSVLEGEYKSTQQVLNKMKRIKSCNLSFLEPYLQNLVKHWSQLSQ